MVLRRSAGLAFGWGFVDASHVSRAFRARFGGTAGELRRTAAR